MNQTGAIRTCTPAQGILPSRVRRNGGFTLVELMVTIAVAAVLLTIAVPSFQHIIASSRLTTTTNSMVSALHTARMEAIKRNADVQFCGTTGNGSDTLGTICGNNQPGAVYALTGTAGAAGTVMVQAAPVISAASMHLQSIQAIRFDPRGLGHEVGQSAPYSNSVVTICSTTIDSDNIRTVSMVTGSILQTDKSSGGCP